ncbi:2-oxo acid dehydrogenase subunit E2 [Cutibacterium sp. V970]|uniref:2-oxo acid dehydrogenase subunit E2 n=1 Tax=Cutibacterium sp. V970 TaxID=3446481 RepID=UPI003EE01B75
MARRIAEQLGVNLHDRRPSGSRGRVCRADVEEAAQRLSLLEEQVATGTPQAEAQPSNEPTESLLSGMRSIIARRLQGSVREAPHFRVNQDVVLDDVLVLRKQINDSVPGVHVSVNDFIVKAAAVALTRMPEVNVQFDGQTVRSFPHAQPRRVPGWHFHGVQPGHVWHHLLRRDHQPTAGRDLVAGGR